MRGCSCWLIARLARHVQKPQSRQTITALTDDKAMTSGAISLPLGALALLPGSVDITSEAVEVPMDVTVDVLVNAVDDSSTGSSSSTAVSLSLPVIKTASSNAPLHWLGWPRKQPALEAPSKTPNT